MTPDIDRRHFDACGSFLQCRPLAPPDGSDSKARMGFASYSLKPDVVARFAERLPSDGQPHSESSQFSGEGHLENTVCVSFFNARSVVGYKKSFIVGVKGDGALLVIFQFFPGAISSEPIRARYQRC